MNTKQTLVSALAAGLLAGAAAAPAFASVQTNDKETLSDKSSCKGKSGCKDKSGCKGKSGCKS